MFSRKTVLILLLAIVFLSLIIRYPLVEHERFETDSYYIHSLSNNIVRTGHAAWTFNSLSYVGYYPFSYPSGAPFLLAELSVLTGLGVDVCILLVNGMIAALFCLVVFCLSREFVYRAEFALLAALLTTLGPRFVDTTYWVGSARGLEVVLIALLVLTAFRVSFSRNNLLVVIAVLIGFACFAVHHMAVLILLFGIAFVVSDLTVRFLPRAFSNRGRRLAITAAALGGVVVAIAVLNYFKVLGNSFELIGETGYFNIPVVSLLVNLVVSYTHQIGFVLPVAVLGVLAFLRTPRFFLKAVFPFAVLLVFVPVLGSSLYVSMVLSPFAAIAGVIWFVRSHGHGTRKERASTALIAMLIVSSLVLTVWSVDRWNRAEQPSGDTVDVANEVFNDATYLNWNGNHVFTMTNSGPLGAQLGGYSDASFIGSGVQATINKDVTEHDIETNLNPSSTPFPGNLYTWLVYKDDAMINTYILALMTGGVSILKGAKLDYHNYSITHSNMIVVVDNNWPAQYVSAYGSVAARFLVEIKSCTFTGGAVSSYCTFESQRVTMYMVQLPKF